MAIKRKNRPSQEERSLVWRAYQDSNLGTWFRRPVLYPLSYRRKSISQSDKKDYSMFNIRVQVKSEKYAILKWKSCWKKKNPKLALGL
jgi:hypothetical protein